MSRFVTELTVQPRRRMIDTSCRHHCSPTATSSAANCTCRRSIYHRRVDRDSLNTFGVVGRRTSGARPACCCGLCTRSASRASSLCASTGSSSRCQSWWIRAGTVHTCGALSSTMDASDSLDYEAVGHQTQFEYSLNWRRQSIMISSQECVSDSWWWWKCVCPTTLRLNW